MSTFNPPTGVSPMDREIEQLRNLLTELRDVLEATRMKLRQDETQAPGEAGKALAELRNLMRTAIDTEKSFEKRRKEKEGIVHDYRLDLDDARLTIGRRLASLRAAGGAGDIPE